VPDDYEVIIQRSRDARSQAEGLLEWSRVVRETSCLIRDDLANATKLPGPRSRRTSGGATPDDEREVPAA
jgi:hypothetical protein